MKGHFKEIVIILFIFIMLLTFLVDSQKYGWDIKNGSLKDFDYSNSVTSDVTPEMERPDISEDIIIDIER